MCSIDRNEFVELNLINNIFFQVSRKSTHFQAAQLVIFYFVYFHFKLHFLYLFFSYSSRCKWTPYAIKFGADCTCHLTSSDVVRFQSYKDVQVSLQSWLIWLLRQMNSYAISGRINECIQAFIAMVSAIWDQGQTPFILLLSISA